MCGIAAIVSHTPVNQELYDALTMLQHRGQDSAGMVTCDQGRINQRKANGLVSDVFRTRHMQYLEGNMGIAHVRYPTAGSSSPALAQPFYVNSPYGICLAHNGNLVNTEKLKSELFNEDLRHINTSSDSEVLLNVFANELQRLGKLKPTAKDIFNAVKAVHRRCSGGYAVVAMIAGYGMVSFRDPNGIRPVVFGQRKTANGTDYMFASESVALDAAGFSLNRDVAPGEAIFIDIDGNLHTEQCSENAKATPCIFEYVYFARPDTIIDGISVYKTRMRMGEKLAEKILKVRPNHDIDVVIPIPDTSRVSAQALAYNLGVKFREGLMKNRYIGRTFIMPGQKQREKSVRRKLNAIGLEFKGKNVLLVDDSIVRGTTCNQIIEMAREAGAKKVYFASAAPAVKYQNVYGIDMPSAQELIAHGRTEKEIEKKIEADWLIYQNLDDLIDSCKEGNPAIEQLECSVFNAEYITGDVTPEYLQSLEEDRCDAKKAKLASKENPEDGSSVDLYNHDA